MLSAIFDRRKDFQSSTLRTGGWVTRLRPKSGQSPFKFTAAKSSLPKKVSYFRFALHERFTRYGSHSP